MGRAKNDNGCFVYMIESECDHTGEDIAMIKVGVSENVSGRLANLQTANPYRLCIIRAWWLPTRADALSVEKRFHDFYAPQRMSGEWFLMHPINAHESLQYDVVEQFVEKGDRDVEELEPFLLKSGYSATHARDIRLAVYGD